MLLVAVLLRAVRTLKSGHYFFKFSILGSLRRFVAGALDEEFFIIEGSV